MCGRYARKSAQELLAEWFEMDLEQMRWAPTWNAAPQSFQPVVRLNPKTGQREAALLRWGLVPSWAKDARIGMNTINARAEEAAAKPAFRSALKKRRCLVPADAFYEWQQTGPKTKRPYAIALTSGEPIVTSGAEHRAICEAYSNMVGKSSTLNEIARDFGMPRAWLIQYLHIHGITHDKEPFSAEELIERATDDLVEDLYNMKRRAVFTAMNEKSWKEIKKRAALWDNFEHSVSRVVDDWANRFVPDYRPQLVNIIRASRPFSAVFLPMDFHYGKGRGPLQQHDSPAVTVSGHCIAGNPFDRHQQSKPDLDSGTRRFAGTGEHHEQLARFLPKLLCVGLPSTSTWVRDEIRTRSAPNE